MPKGKQRQWSTKLTGNADEKARLTPEEIDAINAERPPTQKVALTPLCGAKLSNPTEERTTCAMKAGQGTAHVGFGYCKFHGGNTPAGRKAGAKAMGRAIINERRLAFGDRSSDDNNVSPEEALLEEVRRSVALVRWLEERIGAWQIPDLEDLKDYTRATLPSPAAGGAIDTKVDLGGLPALNTVTFKGTPMATDVNSWLILYREERAHMVKVSKLAIDAGIAERMVRIAEDQGRMLATAIRAVLHVLTLTSDQQALVPQVVPEILRQVASATPQIIINGEVVPV